MMYKQNENIFPKYIQIYYRATNFNLFYSPTIDIHFPFNRF